jgi:DNA-binding PadR family transcriptional regulator
MVMSVRTLCLGILSMGEATGYEIRKKVEEGIFSHFIDASYGSIYPALARMLREGLVRVRTEDDGSGRPPRKVYTITENGRAELARALNTDPAPDKFKSEFLFQMLFMDRVDPAHLAVIYDAYIEQQEEELARCEDSRCELPDHPGARFVNDYGRVMLSTAISFLRERRAEMLKVFAGHGGVGERAGKDDDAPGRAGSREEERA